MAKKMTMADIASLSGVGKSTVSRYFNGGYVIITHPMHLQD